MLFVLLLSYCVVWFVIVLSTFDLSSTYCDVWFIVGLLRHGVVCHIIATFYLCGAIQTDKTNLINRRYQIIVVSMLKNWSHIYSSHYIIKFIGFMPIYYVINLYIVSSCMVLSYLSLIYRSIASLNQNSFSLKKRNKENNDLSFHFHQTQTLYESYFFFFFKRKNYIIDSNVQ